MRLYKQTYNSDGYPLPPGIEDDVVNAIQCAFIIAMWVAILFSEVLVAAAMFAVLMLASDLRSRMHDQYRAARIEYERRNPIDMTTGLNLYYDPKSFLLTNSRKRGEHD